MTNAHTVNRAGLRRFGLTIGAFVAALFGLLLPWIFARPFPAWPWVVAGAFTAVALAVPAALRLVYQWWMRLGAVLGWVNTRLILGLLFFVVFFPVGLLRRLFGKDSMARRLGDQESYRVPSTNRSPKHMERPF